MCRRNKQTIKCVNETDGYKLEGHTLRVNK